MKKNFNKNIPSGENQWVALNYHKTIIASELDQIKEDLLEDGVRADELNESEWITFPVIKTNNYLK